MLMVGGRDRSGAGKVAPGRRPRSSGPMVHAATCGTVVV